MEETNKLTKKNKITLIVGIVLFLILVLSASYAYFAITSVNNATATTVTGRGEELGSPTLTTNTTSLSLDLTVDLMDKSNQRNMIYATPNGSAVTEAAFRDPNESIIKLGNGRYVLATASVSTSNLKYNCTYNFDVSATVAKEITDGSAESVHVIVTSPNGETHRYRLSELLEGTKTITGVINNLTKEENQEFTIESYVYNEVWELQNDLSGNTYKFSVTPKSGTQGFSCNAATEPVITGFAKNLIDSNKMKQTGLEGDGYRFVGTRTGEICSYDNDNYYLPKTADACPNVYSVTGTDINTGIKTLYKYENMCHANNSAMTYSCTNLSGTALTNLDPKNYVCFGTTNKADCVANPDKYMYRVIGVFPDEYGNQHVKLIKNSPITENQYYNDTTQKVIDWHDTDLYKGLNGSYFLTNSNYDYLQNTTWKNKITNWRWTEATEGFWMGTTASMSQSDNAPMKYYDDKNNLQQETYLHEMNRKSKKYSRGNWRYINAKIGLMYASDYYLSIPLIGDDIKSFFNYFNVGNDMLKFYYSSWLGSSATSESGNTYLGTMTRKVYWDTTFYAVSINNKETTARLSAVKNSSTTIIQPTFYLEANVEVSSGTGTSTDPYILK